MSGEQVVLTEIAHIGQEPFSLSLEKLKDNKVKTGYVSRIVLSVKRGEILITFDGKNPTPLSSIMLARGKILEITKSFYDDKQ